MKRRLRETSSFCKTQAWGWHCLPRARLLRQLWRLPPARLQSLLLCQASWTEPTSELSKQLWPAARLSPCRKRLGWRLCLQLQLRRNRRLPSGNLQLHQPPHQPRKPCQPRRLQYCRKTASFSRGMAAANAGPCLEDVAAARGSLLWERMDTLSHPKATLLRRSSDRHRYSELRDTIFCKQSVEKSCKRSCLS